MFKHNKAIIILLISIYYTPMNAGETALSISAVARLVQINSAHIQMTDDDDCVICRPTVLLTTFESN